MRAGIEEVVMLDSGDGSAINIPTVEIAPSGNTLKQTLKRFPVVPATILFLVLFSAIFAPLIAPHDPQAFSISKKLLPPFWQKGGSFEYILGTDHMGRDLLSRLIYGARIAVLVSVVVIVSAGFLGLMVAMLAGYFGGWVDLVLMRIVDIQMSIPGLLFAVALAGVLKPGLKNVVIILTVWSWAVFARVVRGEVLSIKERDFVAMAKVSGSSSLFIIVKHLLPNVLNTFVVLATLQVGRLIIFEASLSYLGLGVQPPTPAWGAMLADGRNYIVDAWWLATVPGLAILGTCLGINLFGDWLRDALDPKLRQV